MDIQTFELAISLFKALWLMIIISGQLFAMGLIARQAAKMIREAEHRQGPKLLHLKLSGR